MHCFFVVVVVIVVFFVFFLFVCLFVFYRAKSSSIMAANHPQMKLKKTTIQFYYGHVYSMSHKNLMVIIVIYFCTLIYFTLLL